MEIIKLDTENILGNPNMKYAIDFGGQKRYFTEKAILELQDKLNKFVLHNISESDCKNCGKPKKQHSDASNMCFNNGFSFYEAVR